MDPVQDAVELTRRLVQLPSESSGQTETEAQWPEREVSDYLSQVLEDSGLRPIKAAAMGNRQNVIARYPGEGPRLLLVGHMDTVSALDMVDPFGGEVRDNRIWGRGACDDKGPLAAAVSVLRWMRRENRRARFDIVFAASIDEECALAGAEHLAGWIDSFDLCIALEPTGLKIVCGHKGDLRLKITTTGKAVHSSSPEQGDNAVEKVFAIASEMETIKDRFAHLPQSEFFGRPTFAVTGIQGGSSSNMIPDTCVMTVDIRLLPDMEPQEILNEVQALVGGRARIDILFAGSGMKTDFRNPVVQRLAETIRRSNEDPGPDYVPYATDCSRLAAKGPCIVWGPGSIAQAHSREEFIEITALEKAVNILIHFLSVA